ncbi:uracil-DNA glycosylase [Breznakibacter xylanolyticus]|uniref:Uracil-DNA glycosylase n=1 Tax=Breznakibacter xylanolyticus TaxID=990 RepID=A0A2W7NMH7_9BACT|nr:uracil-DNA glycosylase [Breznakibacter xylanolyticus]PZX17864.1 uracil-DNA glycosylase [Breznakibacter xylanolyticus]
MEVRMEAGWQQLLQPEFEKEYFKRLTDFVNHEYRTEEVFPPEGFVFNAFNLCPLAQTRVVILGQDPYHDVNQAHGLCFSVNEGVKVPPSLVNIYKEIEADLGRQCPASGNLERWARQGVLLLNATLTVRAHKAGSHQKKGWEQFTDAVIRLLASEKENLVFLLWGNYAIKKTQLIDASRHCILTSVHPSPLSAHRGFFGCRHFSKTNGYLKEKGLEEIEW